MSPRGEEAELKRGCSEGELPAWASLAAVSFIAAFAVALRAWVNFASPLVPKVNGAYYLVQVRALLERGRLAFPDLPLAFLVESAIARLLRAVGASTDQAVTLAVKLVDTIAPPLAVVPASLLARRLRPRIGETSLLPASCATPPSAAAFWVALSYSPIAMSGDFHKNAIGMVWYLCLAASLPGALAGKPRSIAAAAGWTALAAVTHLGAFGAGIALVAAAAVAALVLQPMPRRRRAAFVGACAVAIALAIGGCWLLLDPARRERLAALPLSLFRGPYLLALLEGRVDGTSGSGSPSALASLVIENAIAVTGVVVLARRWRSLVTPVRAIAVAGTASCLFLASPLIGTAWAERFHLMAFAPAAVVLAFAAPRFGRPTATRVTAGVLTTASLAFSLLALPQLGRPSIPVESYPELAGLAGQVGDPDRTLIIARHGLEWWAAWTLRTKVSPEFGVEPSVWDEYERVYFLAMNRPPDGEGPDRAQPIGHGPGPAGRRDAATAFPEVRVSDDAAVVHRGRFFTLWRAATAPAWYPLAPPP